MNRIQLIDAETLYYKPLAHPRMLIDGILADGLAVMAGDSKIGKSWMVLWLCLQISKGEPVWGIPTRKTDVVYLALEDREWRIQQRMQELIEAPPENLHFGFSCGQLGSELESQIEAVLQDYPSTGLIFIDTLQMIRDNVSGKVNAYAQDYRDLSSLKKIADNHGICIFLVHHTRKSKNPEDSFDNINGSTGILGAADFTIVLDKQSRMDDEAGFLLTGRDIEQCERVIRFDKARCRWVMQGTAAQLPASPAYAGYDTALETPYDTAAYNRLLNAALGEQAEDETPLTLTLLVNEESSFKVSAAQEIAMYLNTARLTVTVEAVPWDTFLTRLESGNFDLYYGECRLTADWDLTDLLSASGANNYGRFNDANFAALLTAERSATGDGHTDASAKLYEAFCRQTPIAPICFARSSILTTSGAIEGLTPSLTDPFYNLQDWTIHFS